MPLPEPTAEELNYGRTLARVYGLRAPFASEMFAAGHALGARRSPVGALTADQQIRIAALTFAASITQHADGMSFRDVEQTSIGMADRAAGWIATGTYDWMAAPVSDPGALEFGPAVACSCGPDSVSHVHDAPWGCTTCGCRWYPNPDPEAVETPEQSAAIVDTNLTAMGLTVTGETATLARLRNALDDGGADDALAANLNTLDQAAAEYIAASPEERAAAIRADRAARDAEETRLAAMTQADTDA